MMTFQVEQVLETMPEEITGFTIVWDTRNTGMKVGGEGGGWQCLCGCVDLERFLGLVSHANCHPDSWHVLT